MISYNKMREREREREGERERESGGKAVYEMEEMLATNDFYAYISETSMLLLIFLE